MKIVCITPESFASNCYLVISGEAALVVDPSASVYAIRRALSTHGVQPCGILLTHGHFDHMLSLDELRQAFPALPVYIHKGDADFLTDGQKNAFSYFFREERVWQPPTHLLADGDTIALGEDELRVVHTPGHTPGSICLRCGENDLITGDTLFDGGYGRYDLWGGSYEVLCDSMRRLSTLPEQLTIHPGHGGSARLGQAIRAIGMI